MVAIAWAERDPPLGDIMPLLNALDEELDLNDVFVTADAGTRRPSRHYRLHAVVAFYLQHYVALVYSAAAGQWRLYDDTHVRDLGATWSKVVQYAKSCHAKPVLAFYELVGGSVGDDNSPSPQAGRVRKHKTLLDRLRE